MTKQHRKEEQESEEELSTPWMIFSFSVVVFSVIGFFYTLFNVIPPVFELFTLNDRVEKIERYVADQKEINRDIKLNSLNTFKELEFGTTTVTDPTY